MLNKISIMLDAIADRLEAKGLIKEAYEIDRATDILENKTGMAMGPNEILNEKTQYKPMPDIIAFKSLVTSFISKYADQISDFIETSIDTWIKNLAWASFKDVDVYGPNSNGLYNIEPSSGTGGIAQNIFWLSPTSQMRNELKGLIERYPNRTDGYAYIKKPLIALLNSIDNKLKSAYESKGWKDVTIDTRLHEGYNNRHEFPSIGTKIMLGGLKVKPSVDISEAKGTDQIADYFFKDK